jgi:hypothetical protein
MISPSVRAADVAVNGVVAGRVDHEDDGRAEPSRDMRGRGEVLSA